MPERAIGAGREKAEKKVRIMLDAGHAGTRWNKGAEEGYYESAVVWALQEKLAAELERRGFAVGKTRKSIGEKMDVVARGKAAKGYDFLLSLHTNSASDKKVRRVACIYQVPDDRGGFAEVSREAADNLSPAIADAMGIPPDPGSALRWKNYDRLASSDRDGDGRKNDNYYGILHGARLVGVPAVIAEHSFHSNPETCRWLMEEENLGKLAAAEADALTVFFGVTPPKETTYRVRKGDTPEKIARLFGITPEALIAANIRKHPSMTIDYIRTGWVLVIPPAAEFVPFKVRVTARAGLNVRTGPGLSFSKRGALSCGARTTVREEKNGWGRILWKKEPGWISLEYVKRID
ncbi:MAG: N-acetylmuramoyl-L-alanine amidase [Clostridia bacterium]|nr:N-acetylmuramoyl-L-alanine amidase [Clostridia bacterium]